MYRIIDWSPTNFILEFSEKPIIDTTKNSDWNSRSMHHIDILFSNRSVVLPIVAVDGATDSYEFSIGIYTIQSYKRTRNNLKYS